MRLKADVPALRFLAESAKIHVLHGSRTRPERLPAPPVLQGHGIAAEVYVLPIRRVFGQALLDKAHAVDADMLVTGAYSHGRLRALIFGRRHAFMLDHADLPVLMRH
jgi:nucleotide-binding universal stress UspA family protein